MLAKTEKAARLLRTAEGRNRVGGSLRVGWNYNEYMFQRVSYQLSTTKLTGINDFSSLYVREQVGSTLLSQVSQTIALDHRNNAIDPSRGYYVSITSDLAGLGGTERFVRVGAGAGI